MSAFIAAHADGVRWIETDVKLSSDGMPLLMHDDTLERTTNGQGLVAETSWAEMEALDAGSWFSPAFAGERVPRLADLLVFARDAEMRLNLELKPCPGRTQATTMVAMIEIAKIWADATLRPLISSFDVEALIIASQLHPGWPRGLMLEEWREDWHDLVTLTRATTLHLKADLVTPERLALLRETNLPILCYGIQDDFQAQRLLHSGIRAVFSDHPAETLRTLSS